MKELTLQELHQLSLDILKDVHEFCVQHDIHYSIAYGTLLGAVRHQGFIPWDDDIDIMLLREDYEKLIRTYRSDKFQLVCKENTPGCWINFARICDTQRTYLHTTSAWCANNAPYGVWIDVFPLDSIPADEKTFHLQHDLVKHLYDYSCKVRRRHTPIRPELSLHMKEKLWLKHQLQHRLHHESPTHWVELLDYAIRQNAPQNSPWVSQLACPDEVYTRIARTDMQTGILLPFEDTEVMALRHYEAHLKETFGDYMQLPSRKSIARTARRNKMAFRFFWK